MFYSKWFGAVLRRLGLILSLGVGTVSAGASEPDYLLDLYRHLHSNPELSFQEIDTAARLAQELEAAGFDVTRGVGGHGVVALLRNGPGPTVLVRTDMDALPVPEKTGLPYASQVRVRTEAGEDIPVMHACGHDLHMTVFTGTARALAQQRGDWQGTLMLIAQPAEEMGAGARAMLEDGLFTRFPRPDYNLALHMNADLPAGSIGYLSGWGTANVDSVDIQVNGIGGHGAYPHATRDPIVLAAAIIMDLQTLVSREISPMEPAVVTVGSIHGGTKHNIIPDRVDLQLTVRSYSDAVRRQILDGIDRIASGQAMAAGLPADKYPQVLVRDEYTPSGWNDPQMVERLVEVFTRQFGQDRVVEIQPQMWGEDFARYGRQTPAIPSMMFALGAVSAEAYAQAREGKVRLPSLHSPYFAPVPEAAIATGVAAMTEAVKQLLPTTR